MIPCCCLCGRKAKRFDDPEWKRNDFCPKHEGQLNKLERYGNMINKKSGVIYINKTGDLCYIKDWYIIFGLIVIDNETMYLVEDNSNSA